MTAGAFSEHLDDCEALKSVGEDGRTDLTLCYYDCNGTVGGQALLSLMSLVHSSPLLSFHLTVYSSIHLFPCLTRSSIFKTDIEGNIAEKTPGFMQLWVMQEEDSVFIILLGGLRHGPKKKPVLFGAVLRREKK